MAKLNALDAPLPTLDAPLPTGGAPVLPALAPFTARIYAPERPCWFRHAAIQLQPPSSQPDCPLPIAAILIMLAKGMKPREIAAVFPELTLHDLRSAVLQTAELMTDPEASLPPSGLSVQAIIEEARRNADVSEEEAMTSAVEQARAYRREKAALKATTS